jgi:CRISPR/Cas system-associated exonuclease Cas4 (RecB family)
VPVEVKSRSFGRGPHDGEKAQLFACCLLVEEWGQPVRERILQYADREMRMPFGDNERAWLLGLIAEMQRYESAADVARSLSQARKCQRCGVRANCGQALA